VVELVELDKSDENELMLPHVFEKLHDEDSEGPSGRVLGVNGFDVNLDLDGKEESRAREGVVGAVLLGEGGVAVHLVGDANGLESENGSGIGWYVGWRATSLDEEDGVSSIR